MSRVAQERVQKLFDLDYNCWNWSWLLDPTRFEVPLPVLRSVMAAGEEATVDPLVEEEA